MTVADHEYARRVGYGLCFSENRPRLLKVYSGLALLAVAIGAALGFAI
jgi:hypothetical protein